MKPFSPTVRLAELDLEEAVIREGYMANVHGLMARMMAERLCEICTEREYITGLLVVQHSPDARDQSCSE